jgi:hypothetical protein
MKLYLSCAFFCFILGAYTVVLVNTNRDLDRSCQIKVDRGQIATVHIGRYVE